MKTHDAGKGWGGMAALLIASLIWAFSFGLIKHKLVDAGLDPFLVALARLVLSCAVFAPFLRLKNIHRGLAGRLTAIGAVQYGLMYVTYLASFHYLAAHQVALFTIFTPIYVTLMNDGLACRFHARSLLAAVLAVIGAGVIVFSGDDLGGTLAGFGLMQVSNLCFAFGQVAYRRVDRHVVDSRVFALLYLGGVLVATVPAVTVGRWPVTPPTGGQLLTLLYLGLVPSGVCFYLWNLGARRTSVGLLAVLNNVKIPLAVLCSLVFFGEKIGLVPLLLGGGVLVLASVLSRGAD